MTCPNRLKQESRLTDSEGYNVGGLGFKKILAVKLYDQKEEHKGTWSFHSDINVSCKDGWSVGN